MNTPEIDVKDYEYDLPENRIGQNGVEPRDSSKLLVFKRNSFDFKHEIFYRITDYLRNGDVLVINESKVIPARLYGNKQSGAKIEVLLLDEIESRKFTAFVKPGKRLKIGDEIVFSAKDHQIKAKVTKDLMDGSRVLEFDIDIKPYLDQIGHLPLPPYITNKEIGDRYQTIYAKSAGSVATPTAGLHFTDELLQKIQNIGVEIARITLHVGAGTFKPVMDLTNHLMHEEKIFIPEESSILISKAKQENRRIIAVGTTVVRSLESSWNKNEMFLEFGERKTNLFIKPIYQFQIIDALITNFHLPKSTLLMLVAAFSGLESMKQAYQIALESDYRFYSLGDAMFIY